MSKKPLPVQTEHPVLHKSDRKPNPFKLDLFTKCCGMSPRYTKEGGEWLAICPVCKWAARANDPRELAPAWNTTFQK
jgi:hypothetical protein